MLVFGWTMIALSGLGMLASVICWAVTDRQARRWEAMRQEVREALVYDPINPLVEGFIVFDEEHIAVRHSIVVCEKHRTVSPDYCAQCRVEEYVALTRPGHVVHSD